MCKLQFNLAYLRTYTTGPAEYYLKWGIPLHRAAMGSDWKTAEKILQQQPNLATAVVDIAGMNVLHVDVEPTVVLILSNSWWITT